MIWKRASLTRVRFRRRTGCINDKEVAWPPLLAADNRR